MDPIFEDLAFDPPPAWSPRTVVEFSAPDAEAYAYPPSVIVIREAMRDEDSVPALVDRQEVHVAQLPGGRVLRRAELPLDGLPALELAYEWASGPVLVEQVTTLTETVAGARRIVTSFTTICAKEDASFLAPVFLQMIESIRLGVRPISGIVPAPLSEPTLPAFGEMPQPPAYVTEPPPSWAVEPGSGERARDMLPPAMQDFPMPGLRQRRRER